MEEHPGRRRDLLRSWPLLLGPGSASERIRPLLDALARSRPEGAPHSIEQLEDVEDLYYELPETGRLVLDSGGIELEDLGILRRFLARMPGWEVDVQGEDPGAMAARRLLLIPGVRWLQAPLDTEQLESLVTPPAWFDAEGDLLGRRPASESEGEGDDGDDDLDEDLEDDDDLDDLDDLEDDAELDEDDDLLEDEFEDDDDLEEDLDDDDELDDDLEDDDLLDDEALALRLARLDEEVERILNQPPAHTPDVSTLDAAAGDAFRGDEPEPATEESPALSILPEHAEHAPAALSIVPPAPYFKHQVADLADVTLRIELVLEQAREAAGSEEQAAQLDELELEIQRLSQFTRTLGYVASPPVPGRTRVRVDELIEELLAQAGSEEDSPRYLWRSAEPLEARCDKTLLHQALEAVLYLVHHAAGRDGTVHLEGRVPPAEPGSPEAIEVAIRFPAGPLSELSPEQVLEPYGLRRLLPGLGPNALAAAAGILRGQGGGLRLERAEEDRLLWVLHLSRHA